MDIDFREVDRCTCLTLRRASRKVTQIYDRLLEPADLTVSQFGLLAHLLGARRTGRTMLPIGALAEQIGMDPTTLNRSLKPLQASGLVANLPDPRDRRVRALAITDAGRARFEAAVPLWRQARAKVATAVGVENVEALTGLLKLSSSRLEEANVP